MSLRSKSRKLWVVVLLLAGLYAMACVYFSMSVQGENLTEKFRSHESIGFDRGGWARADGETKYKMANDLITNRRLINLTPSQVIDNLGRPELGGGEKGFQKNLHMMYILCDQRLVPSWSPFVPKTWLGNNDYWVIEVFVEGGVVTRVTIVTT